MSKRVKFSSKAAASTERLIKSAQRVRDLGEVFTPSHIVSDMLNLLPADTWKPFPPATFLEPACGDGNFVVAIVERKLARVAQEWRAGTLRGGTDAEALWFHGLAALSSVYGVDISADNIVGGTPDHPVGARDRVLQQFIDWITEQTGKRPAARSRLRSVARWIVEANLIVGDMLPVDVSGSPRTLHNIKLVEYSWQPSQRRVSLTFTDMQQVLDEANASGAEQLSMFAAEPPPVAWSGKYLELHHQTAPH